MRYLILLLFLPFQTFGQAGVNAPVHANYQSPYDMVGLCTANRGNDKLHYWKSGHCNTIYESLTANDCIKKKLEEIRLRMVGDSSEEQIRKAGGKNTGGLSLGMSCDSKNGDQTFENTIVKDKNKFALFMTQIFAMITIEQSKWQVNHGGNTGQGSEVKCETNCGLLGIKKSDMENEKYKCGCEIPNKQDNNRQYDPTMDGHLNLRCGITMALFNVTADKDASSLFGGGRNKSKDHPEDTRHGFEKIFKSLEPTDADDRNLEAFDTPLKRLKGKMKSYCDAEAFATSNNRQLEQQLRNPEGLNELGMPISTTR